MKNHIALSALRDPPEHLLRALRDIDANADLHYMGEGRWVLGTVRPNWQLQDNGRTRRATARKMLAHEWRKLQPDPAAVKLARLMLANFFEVAQYEVQGEPTSAIAEDFRERDWNWRVQPDATFERHLDMTEGIPAWEALRARHRDYAETEARDVYRHTFKGRRTVGPRTF